MPNRTISLDDISDGVRKQLVLKGVNFSQWVRLQLMQYGERTMFGLTETEVEVKPSPPKNYMCRHCLGSHWTADCKELRQ
jgi:hypothetical protein|tara:strand:+ start:996 stop:1235 length:240 start_codon:yes stop_codon:yes gene_type:complete